MRVCTMLFATISLLLGASSLAQSGNAVEAPIITPSEFEARRQSDSATVVIDVRTPEEYAAGHIPGALNIAFDQVAVHISEVEAPHGVVLYCMLGPRARKGEAALLAAGYTSVLHLEGGLAAWQKSGLPVESAK